MAVNTGGHLTKTPDHGQAFHRSQTVEECLFNGILVAEWFLMKTTACYSAETFIAPHLGGPGVLQRNV